MQECIDLHFPLFSPYHPYFWLPPILSELCIYYPLWIKKIRTWLWNAGMCWLACLHFLCVLLLIPMYFLILFLMLSFFECLNVVECRWELGGIKSFCWRCQRNWGEMEECIDWLVFTFSPLFSIFIPIFFFLPYYLSCAYVIHCLHKIKKLAVTCRNALIGLFTFFSVSSFLFPVEELKK